MSLFAGLGPHADFIVAAYAITVAIVAALVGWIVLDYRMQQRTLEALEAQGVTRRAERPVEKKPAWR
jgi:heme exporter protein D